MNFPYASSKTPPVKLFETLPSPFQFKPMEFQRMIKSTYSNYAIPQDYADMSVDSLCHPDQFRLLPQQVWLGRYANDQARSISGATPYSGTIIYHGMGSGKTISGIAIAEGLKYISSNQPAYRSHQRILFVVPAQLIPQVYNEIAGTAPTKILINGKAQSYVSSQSSTRIRELEQNIIQLEQKKFAIENEFGVSSALQQRVDMTNQTYILVGVFVSYWEEKAKLFSSLKGKHVAPDTFEFPLQQRTAVDKAIQSHRITRVQHNKDLTSITNQIQQTKRSIKSLQDSMHDKIDQTYHIMSHQKFVNELFEKFDNKNNKPGYTTRQLQKPNTVLIIDEYQNIVSEPIPPTTGTQHGRMYAKLWTAIHQYAHPSLRLFLMSGTPIYDKPFEIGLGINLLRPRIPFPLSRSKFDTMFLDKSGKKFTHNMKLFRYMTSGYVSYFSGGNPKAYPQYRTQIMQCPFEKDMPQTNEYIRALAHDIEDIMQHPQGEQEAMVQQEEREEMGTILVRSRNCCNLALPSTLPEVPSTFDTAYIENLSDTARRLLQSHTSRGNPRTRAQAMLATIRQRVQGFDKSSPVYLKLVLETVRQYSVKFAQLIAHLLGFPTTPEGTWNLDKRKGNPPGTVFIFTQYREYGANIIAGLLDMVGFIDYDSSSNTKFSDIYNGKRYILWTGETTKDRRDRNITLFNDSSNANGNGIKILIGTLAIREGVSLKRVREVHIMEPWWNESRLQQIMYRAIRFCSHVDVDVPHVSVYQYVAVYGTSLLQTISELRDKAQQRIDRGKGPSIPLNTRIRDMLRRWAMVDPTIRAQSRISAVAMNMTPLMNFDMITADGFVYQKAKQKQALIKSFERILKSNAIDCQLHHWGNLKRTTKSCGQGCRRQTKHIVPEPIQCMDEAQVNIRPRRLKTTHSRVVTQYINQSIHTIKPSFREWTEAIGAVLRYPSEYETKAVRMFANDLAISQIRARRILSKKKSKATNQRTWLKYLIDLYVTSDTPSDFPGLQFHLQRQLMRGARENINSVPRNRNMIRAMVRQKDKASLNRFVEKYVPTHPRQPKPKGWKAFGKVLKKVNKATRAI